MKNPSDEPTLLFWGACIRAPPPVFTNTHGQSLKMLWTGIKWWMLPIADDEDTDDLYDSTVLLGYPRQKTGPRK